jgi:hypothetical protein
MSLTLPAELPGGSPAGGVWPMEPMGRPVGMGARAPVPGLEAANPGGSAKDRPALE